MDTRIFKTLVKNDHTLGKNKFVLGRIIGAMSVMCKEDPAHGAEYGHGRIDVGAVIVTKTTEEKYAAFADLIESWYEGLCTFDYVEEIEEESP